LTAVPEVGKTYLGKVVRLAEFGAFVEIIPGTDGLLHISEIAEHRVKEVKDELKEGDQVLVKVLGIEGNRIKLSRKAILREQRAKISGGEGESPAGGRPSGEGSGGEGGERSERPPAQPRGEGEETITFEGGGDFGDDEGGEPNFNREDANRETVAAGRPERPRGDRPHGGGGDRGGRAGGRHRRGGSGRGPRGGGDRGPRGGGGDRGNR
jgi:polyribonucleotide nucleotidyltransferase